MRKDSLVGVTLVVLAVLPGCASRLGSSAANNPVSGGKTTAQYNTPPLFGNEGHDMLGNTLEKSAWQRISSPVTDNKLLHGVASGVQQGATKVGSFVKRDAQPNTKTDVLNLAHKADPSDPKLPTSMALMMEQKGQMDQAAKYFDQALRRDPKNLEALLGYAHLLDRQGRLDEALKYYQQASAAHPQAAGVFNDLGLCLARMNKLPESLGPLHRAVALDPEKGLYRNNVATVLAELGRADEALAHLKATNTESVALYNLGYLLQQRGQLQAAAHYFSQAAAIDPSFDQARRWAEELSATRPAQSASAYQDAVAAVQKSPHSRPENVLAPSGQPYQAR